ncbi:MAG: nucleotidyl transferase AbiEii/AbiGii toxin family protein [Nanoarchaeota archaeon]|nr:nucleotidyl transferase AbiEii/AbiGii toxin family protein [Nanoarchaeota archaeon]
MLTYEKLEQIARLKRLSLNSTEKDYLQNLILFSIYSNVGKELVFKGGTCLYKIYKLDRFSEDLDFTAKNFDAKKIADKIIKDLILLNIKGKIKEIKEYRNEINVRLIFNGPLYRGSKETQCFIPLNISLREQLLLEPKKEYITSLYKELPNFYVFAMNEKEILAEKIRAIFMRQKPRDVYDLYFLLEKGAEFDMGLINKKLSLYNLKFDLKELKNRIEKMKGFWQTDLKNLMIKAPEFEEVRGEIIKHIDNSL